MTDSQYTPPRYRWLVIEVPDGSPPMLAAIRDTQEAAIEFARKWSRKDGTRYDVRGIRIADGPQAEPHG